MLLGILSDTHNNLHTTRAALERFRAEGVRRLIHCGDITTGAVVMLFAGWDVTFVWGNVDRTRADVEAAARMVGLPLPRELAILTVDGLPLAVTHGHDGQLEHLIATQEYRYILHGHTHQRRDERFGHTRVINPGALGGRRPQPRSVAILDPGNDDLRFLEIPDET
ncbi:MAG: metallophosphoesterase [Anaerolineae bacterium]